MSPAAKPDFGPKPGLDWLPVDRLTVDAKYQRDTASRRSRAVIEKITATFRWSRFGIVSVVKHGGGYHVVDGQHRVEACRALGLQKVPAVVLPHATLEAAAADFVAINRDRVTVTPLHIHHAMLAAGDPEAQAIARACKAGGVEICRYPVPASNMKPGQTLAIGTVARLVKQHGEQFAGEVLGRIRKGVGGGEPGAVNAAAIREAAGSRFVASMEARPLRVAVVKQRKCLRCSSPFRSEGPGNRMCVSCRRGSE